jgi:signal transduction histidine kinase
MPDGWKDPEKVARISRAGSRFSLSMLVAALLLGLLLAGLSAAQLAQVRRFSRDLLVMRARHAAAAFFIRYMRDPAPERIPAIVEESPLGPHDLLQVLRSDGRLLGASRHAGERGFPPPSGEELTAACERSRERLRETLPWGSHGRLRMRRSLLETVLEPSVAEIRRVGGAPVLEVLFVLPVPERPPPAPPPPPRRGAKGLHLFLERSDLGGTCLVIHLGVDASAQRGAVLTHVGILGLAVLTTLLVLGVNIVLYRALKQRERMAESMQRARRVQALGEMAATLAHEIKNPVGAIRGYAQLLREGRDEAGGSGSERVDRAVSTIVRESTRLEELVRRTLEFTRPGELALEAVDLREVADAAGALLANRAAARGVDIVTDHAESPVRVRADRDRMEQVIANLLDNAIEASEPGSAVVLHTGTSGRQARVSVRDRGRGIAEERLEEIFGPFHTDRPDGTGLGLPVARSIVEAHAGTITARSEGPGRGAVFTVELPA